MNDAQSLLERAKPFLEAGLLDHADVYAVALVAPRYGEHDAERLLGLAFAAREGSGLFCIVCSTAASMSSWVNSCGASRIASRPATTASAITSPAKNITALSCLPKKARSFARRVSGSAGRDAPDAFTVCVP